MEKMWAGRAQEQLDQTADDFNSSIAVDQRMAEQDITGSIAHAKMLAAQEFWMLERWRRSFRDWKEF